MYVRLCTIFLLSFLFSLLNFHKFGHAQTPQRVQNAFDKLAKAYHSKTISAGQYVVKVDSLTHQLFSEGIHFETGELVGLLSLYEEIAWNNPQDGRDRVNYYFLFFNNARMFKQKGASMYYAEKITEEYKKNGEDHPLIEQLQKCKIYQELRLYDKVVSIFEGERSYLSGLPKLLQQDSIDPSVGLNAMYILSPTIMGYIDLNDTVSVYQTADLARQIGKALKHASGTSRTQMLYNDLLRIDIDHSVANFEHNYDSARILLNHMEALKSIYKDQATNFIDLNVIRLRIENYLNLRNPDSLSVYLEKYASSPAFGSSQKADIAEFKGKLLNLQGDYKQAYTALVDAIALERDVQAALMKESNDLLYAYTQAEHSEISLKNAEKVKQQRTLLLVVISSFALIVVLSVYLMMLRRNRKAKEQIEALNNVANMQIIAMEEAKYQAVREEQQRLGQDLHDGLSSSIAGIRYRLELLAMDVNNVVVKNKLAILQKEIAKAYEVARNKSHEWFSAADGQDEQSFEQRIKVLTDNALPDNLYHKNIHIDDHALLGVNADTRISLLRIIQEAITNIIKHANAKSVEILIYEETDKLLLVIGDNGRGLKKTKLPGGESTMGLQSIRRRVDYLKGDMVIHSDTKGTEIVISIPLISP